MSPLIGVKLAISPVVNPGNLNVPPPVICTLDGADSINTVADVIVGSPVPAELMELMLVML